jgi:hypothetical protein
MIRRIGAGDPEKSLALLGRWPQKAKDDATRLTFLGHRRIAQGTPRTWKRRRGWQQLKAEWPGQVRKPRRPAVRADCCRSAFSAMRRGGGLKLAASTQFGELEPAPPLSARPAQIMASSGPAQSGSIGTLRGLPSAELRGDALRALAVDRRSTGSPSDSRRLWRVVAAERRDALATLASRPAYAERLLDAVAGGKVPANHLTADLVTNLRNLNDEGLNKRIESVWGIVRSFARRRGEVDR